MLRTCGLQRPLAVRVVQLLLLQTLLALAGPATAQAAWTAPVTLSPAGHGAFQPQVGIDQSGNAVFIWRRPDGTTDCGGSPGCDRVQVVARSAAGALSAVQTVSPPGERAAELPQVGVDPNGNAVIVWSGGTPGSYSLQTRARSAAGILSDTQIVSPADQAHGFPQLGVDQNGNALFVWRGDDPTTSCGGSPCSVLTRVRSATGALGATQGVATGAIFSDPDVAIEQDGDAVFVWSYNYYDGTTTCGVRTPPGCARVQIRTRSASGALSTIKTLSPNGQDGTDAHVAVDQSGNAVAAWTRDKGNCGATCYSVQTRARMADGSLSATQTLSGMGGAGPEVALDQSGNAVYVWTRWDGVTGSPNCRDQSSLGCVRVQARARSATGSLSSIQTLSGPGQDASNPHVAVDQAGNAIFVWERFDGTTDCAGGPDPQQGCQRIQTRTRAADGTLSATKTLSAASGDGVDPQIAVNQAGNAAAVWSRFGGFAWRVQAAFGP
jgi:hypothetical protein